MMTSNVRRFTIQTKGSTKVVESPYSDKEAWSIARSIKGNALVESFDLQVAKGYRMSAKQISWVHVLAVEEMTRREQAGLRVQPSPAPQQNTVPVAAKGEMDGILNLFAEARKHLKRPRILIAVPQLGPDGSHAPYVLSVAGIRSKRPGWINVVRERDDWYVGQIDQQGVLHSVRGLTEHPGLVEMLRRLALEPAKVAAEYGKLMGVCCFCGRHLEDPRSTEVGYGPVCAQHFALPWGEYAAIPTPLTVEAPKPSLPQVSTSDLTYDSKSRTFSCEASDIDWKAGQWPQEVEVVSTKTGASKVFKYRRPENDADGDLRWVDYWCEDLVCRIFND